MFELQTKLRVPQADRLANVEQLCLYPSPYRFPANYEELFKKSMQEIMTWHQQESDFYGRFLDLKKFDIAKWNGDMGALPFIVADFFKQHEAKSVPDERIFLHLTSSGTMGQKSQIFFDEWSIRVAQMMVDRIFAYYEWISEEEANYVLYSYEPERDSKLGTAYTDHFLTKYAPIHRTWHALRLNGRGGHEFDIFGTIDTLVDFEKEERPVRIFGFPSFLYFTLQRMRDLKMQPLRLHPKSLLFLGGGWKGHKDQAIDKKEFYSLVTEWLGIPDERLRDGFGSVEHCVPYVECNRHHFHVPIWSKVVIRDFRDLGVLSYEKAGFLQFISPYITSMPAHSVLMGDQAVLHRGESCGCGLGTDWFEILGRAGTSKNKSCALAAAELLKALA